jgi:hypothetical protein
VLVRRTETVNDAGLAIGDPSAVALGPSSGSIFTSDPDARPHSLWQIDLRKQEPVRTIDLDGITREPAGLSWSESRGTLFVIDDDELALHEIDGEGQRVRSVDLAESGARDPEGVAVGPTGDQLFVADGRGQRILVLDLAGELIRSLDFEGLGFENAEGIAYDPTSGHLFVAEGTNGALFELDAEGGLAGAYALAALGVVSAQGLALAARDPHDRPSLLIADELVRGEPDGRIVEVMLVRRPRGSRLLTSLVGDVDGFGFHGDEPGFAKGDLDLDGRLGPGEQLPTSVLGQLPLADQRDPEDDPSTDAMQLVTEAAPLQFVHSLKLAGATPLWARLTLVIGDARAVALRRNLILVDGQLIGEVIGSRSTRLAAGSIVETVVELPPAALERLRDGQVTVEIVRPPGTGDDDLMLDYSRLEVAVARRDATAGSSELQPSTRGPRP